jgi:hypothetical protein
MPIPTLADRLHEQTDRAVTAYNVRATAEIMWQRKRRGVIAASLDAGQSVAAAEREADSLCLDEWEEFRKADAELSRQIMLVDHWRFLIANHPTRVHPLLPVDH